MPEMQFFLFAALFSALAPVLVQGCNICGFYGEESEIGCDADDCFLPLSELGLNFPPTPCQVTQGAIDGGAVPELNKNDCSDFQLWVAAVGDNICQCTTSAPTEFPSAFPSEFPSEFPSSFPTDEPTLSVSPTAAGTAEPTTTRFPTTSPSVTVTSEPTVSLEPTMSRSPTSTPSAAVTSEPTVSLEPTMTSSPTSTSAAPSSETTMSLEDRVVVMEADMAELEAENVEIKQMLADIMAILEIRRTN